MYGCVWVGIFVLIGVFDVVSMEGVISLGLFFEKMCVSFLSRLPCLVDRNGWMWSFRLGYVRRVF